MTESERAVKFGEGLKRGWGRLAPVLSLLMALWMTLLFAVRPDSAAAMTLFPAWFWLLLGVQLARYGWRRTRKGLVMAAFLFWGLYAVLFVGEARSLARSAYQTLNRLVAPPRSAIDLRVVTLNCRVGNEDAALDALRLQPDILLLQESPGREFTERLGRRLFNRSAGVVWGFDASLIVRGEATPVRLPPSLGEHISEATVTLPSGRVIEVISLRLEPTVFRIDFWSPDDWRAQERNRRTRMAQAQAIAERLAQLPDDRPVILGGDFNAPAGDAVFRPLHLRLRDSFRESGVGWGDTALNPLPFHRIDQVWISRHFRSVRVRAVSTPHSDHRMTVADLRWER